MKAIIAWLFRCRHTRSNIWIDMVSNRVSHTCLDCDAVREEGGDWGVRKPLPPCSEPSSQALGSRAWIGEYPRYSIVGQDGKHTPISRAQYLRAMAGEDIDTTGLCTVRDWADEIIKSGLRVGFNEHEGFVSTSRVGPLAFTPLCGQLAYVKDGKHYQVQTVVTVTEADHKEAA